MATVRALANAVEARDAYTGKHAERVAAYGMRDRQVMGLASPTTPEVEFGFLLHDVGKVAIPDAILFKPEPLDDQERALMERHPIIGWEILRDVDFLGEAKPSSAHHHERWDGEGYPDGLAGEEIPLAARVFAVADTFDALTTDRPYRAAHRRSPRPARMIDRGARAPSSTPRSSTRSTRCRTRRSSGSRQEIAGERPQRPDRRRRPLHPQADRHDARGRARLRAPPGRRRRGGARARGARPPGLVFLDIEMPRLDGIGACRRLRAHDRRDDRDAHRRAARSSRRRRARRAPTCSSPSRSARWTCCGWWTGSAACASGR